MDENLNNNGLDPNNSAFETNNKKKNFNPVPIIIALLVVVVAGICIFFATKGGSPEKVVRRETTANSETLKEEKRIITELFDDSVSDAVANGQFSFSSSLRLLNAGDSYYSSLNGAGFGMNFDVDSSKKELSGSLNAGLSGSDLIELKLYSNENDTTIYIPSILKESFTIGNKGVISQLKQLDFVGNSLDDVPDFDLNFFSPSEAYASMKKLQDKSISIFEDKKKELLDSFEYEDAEEKTEGPDGKSYKSYNVKIDGEKAVTIFADYINEFYTSDEFDTAINSTLDSMYEIAPGAESQLGSKEDVKSQFKKEYEELEKQIRDTELDDITVTVTPLDNGTMYTVKQKINEIDVDLTAVIDRKENEINVDLKMKNERDEEFNITYTDTCDDEGGVIKEDRTLDIEIDGEKVTFTNNAEYDRSSHKLTAEFAINADDEKYTLNFDGTAEKDGSKIDIQADKITLSDGNSNIELAGSLTIGGLENAPEPIEASENIRVTDIDMGKAMSLYQEAQGNIQKISSALESVF